MTTLAAGPSQLGAMPASPSARRLSAPSWRDGRLLIGVLLLLVSVVVGARVLGGSDHTTPVLVAGRDLSAGHVLVAGDLDTAAVRLAGGQSGSYFPAGGRAALLGRAVTRPVGRGELLPSSAIAAGQGATTEQVSVTVAAGRFPGLVAGDRVDVYASQVAKVTGADVCTTLLVGSALEVVDDVPAGGSGAAAAGIVLRVPPELAPTLVHAGESASLDLVKVPPTGTPAAAPAPSAPAASAPAASVPAASAPVQALGGVTSGACDGK